jgi:subtilisin family serine protease
MRQVLIRTALFAMVLGAGPANADLSKLDHRARAALAALETREDIEALRGRRMAVSAVGNLDVFIRGTASRAELEAAGAIVRTELPGLCTAFVPADAVERVAALPGVTRIRGAAPVELELDSSVPVIGVGALRGAGPTFPGANGEGVLVGAVDSGVDYDHGDFKDESGNTRLVSLWDQTFLTGTHPAGFNYGGEWTAAQLNAGTCAPNCPIDEVGHGTHVFGIAAGDGSQTGGPLGGPVVPAYTYAGVAPKADLVMVKSDFNDTHVVDGVAYIFAVATARGQSAVVNLSLGSQYGPHDGTSDFEAGLNALTGPGRIIVKSAGNDRGLSRHAQVSTLGGNVNVTMTVSGSFQGAQFAIDGYYESSDNIQVRVTTPSNTVITVNRGVAPNAAYPGQDTPNGVVYVENGALTTDGGDYEVYVEVLAGSGDNMNGTWTFTFIPQGTPPVGEVDLWRFYSTVTSFFLAGVQDDELISEPGNADSLITVAAWTTRRTWTTCQGSNVGYSSPVPTLGEVSWFSSPGPTRDGRQKPDITAPGAGIASTNSFDAFPNCGSNASFLLNDGANHRIDQGTSMAAPHVTGSVALLLENFGPLTPQAVKNYLYANAKVDAQTGAVWNKDYGRGKLFLDHSVDALLSLFYAERGPEGVTLRWRFGDPSQFSSVSLERALSVDGPWYPVDAELRLEEGATVALDRGVTSSNTSYYRLVASAPDAAPMIFGPIEVATGPQPARFSLAHAWPNPSRGMTRFDFVVPRAARIRLVLFDVQGREIAVLAGGTHRAGRYQAVWNGTNGVAPAPSGLYFIRLETPEGALTQRVAIAR